MAEGDGAAVRVHLRRIDAELLCRLEDDGGEGLVDLPVIDVARLHAGLAESLLARRRRRGEHEDGIAAERRRCADARTGTDAVLLHETLRREDDRAGAVG